MTAATTTTTPAAHAATERPSALATYRDDGPLARALGRVVPGGRRTPAVPLLVVAVAPLIVAIAVGGDDTSHGLAAAVIAWLILWGGASSGASLSERLNWAVPPLVRLGEYAALIWIATLHGASAEPAAFALLCALAFRHYDLVYRLRHRGTTPAPWVDALTLGWDGRLVLAFVLLVAGLLPGAWFVWAGLIGAVVVGEAVHGWVAQERGGRTVDYEDEEDEGQ
jgi:Family of unknown function (DUF5941)